MLTPVEFVTLLQFNQHASCAKFQMYKVWQAHPPLVELVPVENGKFTLVQTASHLNFAPFQVDFELQVHCLVEIQPVENGRVSQLMLQVALVLLQTKL